MAGALRRLFSPGGKAAGAAAPQAAGAAPPEPVPAPPGEAPNTSNWRYLPAMPSAVPGFPLTVQTARFESTLTTRSQPRFLAPLGHDRSALHPSGIADNIAVLVPPASPAPAPPAAPAAPAAGPNAGLPVKEAKIGIVQRFMPRRGGAASGNGAVSVPSLDEADGTAGGIGVADVAPGGPAPGDMARVGRAGTPVAAPADNGRAPEPVDAGALSERAVAEGAVADGAGGQGAGHLGPVLSPAPSGAPLLGPPRRLPAIDLPGPGPSPTSPALPELPAAARPVVTQRALGTDNGSASVRPEALPAPTPVGPALPSPTAPDHLELTTGPAAEPERVAPSEPETAPVVRPYFVSSVGPALFGAPAPTRAVPPAPVPATPAPTTGAAAPSAAPTPTSAAGAPSNAGSAAPPPAVGAVGAATPRPVPTTTVLPTSAVQRAPSPGWPLSATAPSPGSGAPAVPALPAAANPARRPSRLRLGAPLDQPSAREGLPPQAAWPVPAPELEAANPAPSPVAQASPAAPTAQRAAGPDQAGAALAAHPTDNEADAPDADADRPGPETAPLIGLVVPPPATKDGADVQPEAVAPLLGGNPPTATSEVGRRAVMPGPPAETTARLATSTSTGLSTGTSEADRGAQQAPAEPPVQPSHTGLYRQSGAGGTTPAPALTATSSPPLPFAGPSHPPAGAAYTAGNPPSAGVDRPTTALTLSMTQSAPGPQAQRQAHGHGGTRSPAAGDAPQAQAGPGFPPEASPAAEPVPLIGHRLPELVVARSEWSSAAPMSAGTEGAPQPSGPEVWSGRPSMAAGSHAGPAAWLEPVAAVRPRSDGWARTSPAGIVSQPPSTAPPALHRTGPPVQLARSSPPAQTRPSAPGAPPAQQFPPSGAISLARLDYSSGPPAAVSAPTTTASPPVVFRSPPRAALDVQRAVAPAAATEPTAAEPAPAPAPAAEASTGGDQPAHQSAHGDNELDELSRRLYDRIRDRLKAELYLDRERAGQLSDLTV